MNNMPPPRKLSLARGGSLKRINKHMCSHKVWQSSLNHPDAEHLRMGPPPDLLISSKQRLRPAWSRQGASAKHGLGTLAEEQAAVVPYVKRAQKGTRFKSWEKPRNGPCPF